MDVQFVYNGNFWQEELYGTCEKHSNTTDGQPYEERLSG